MKKILPGLIIASFVLIFNIMNPHQVAAQTQTQVMSVSAQLELIQKLLAQVTELQKLLTAMQSNIQMTPKTKIVQGAPVISSVTSDETNGIVYLRVKGQNLQNVSKAFISTLVDDEAEIGIVSWTSDVITIELASGWLSAYNKRNTNRMALRLNDNQGRESNYFRLNDAKHKASSKNTSRPEMHKVSFRNGQKNTHQSGNEYLNNPDSAKQSFNFNFTLRNYRKGLVLDVEPYVQCNDQYLQGLTRNCAQYLFDLTQKAGETYFGEAGDPYVKGGALYRFTGLATQSGESLSLVSYPNPDYYPGSNETEVIPDRINYRFILRDINQGGKEIWSREYIVQFKG